MSVSPPVPFAADRSALTALLRLYADWGVDCALGDAPIDRTSPPPARTTSRHNTPEERLPEKNGTEKSTIRQDAAAQITARRARPDQPATAPEPTADPWTGVTDLATLLSVLDQAPDITLRRTATHTLAPVAVPGAALMLVGEIPDSDEDRTGTLFAGDTGTMLARMLASIGLKTEDASRCAALPWRPPGGRDASDAERQACTPLLKRAIAVCAPQIVVTLGPTPARMLMGASTQLNRVRGRFVTLDLAGAATPIRLLPMRHPGQVAISPQARKDAWSDLLTLAVALESLQPL